MTFKEAVKSGIRNVFNFKGRASRSEFWWFSLFLLVLELLVFVLGSGVILVIVFSIEGFIPADISSITFAAPAVVINYAINIIIIAIYVANIPISIRRLHDVNKSAWWVILWYLCYAFLYVVVEIYPANFASIDHNHLGAWLCFLILCLWIIWAIVLLVFCVKKGTQGNNRFGADPLDLSAQEVK